MAGPLTGKVALVTGAARNIGRSIALALAADGAALALNARSSGPEIEAVADEIRAAGGRAVAVLADVSDPSDVKRLFAEVSAGLGPVDILVNNAAVRRETPLAKITFEEWRAVLASILDASFLCAQAAAETMPEGGRIINLGGLSAHAGATDRAHVVAAKSGLVGLTKGLAMELAPRGITVNLVAPGRIATDRKASGLAEPIHHQKHTSPLGIEGSTEDVAGMVRMLAGPGGRYVTGQTIHVNGGIYLP